MLRSSYPPKIGRTESRMPGKTHVGIVRPPARTTIEADCQAVVKIDRDLVVMDWPGAPVNGLTMTPAVARDLATNLMAGADLIDPT
jgi:hypothetical protein